jgi:MFS family permease
MLNLKDSTKVKLTAYIAAFITISAIIIGLVFGVFIPFSGTDNSSPVIPYLIGSGVVLIFFILLRVLMYFFIDRKLKKYREESGTEMSDNKEVLETSSEDDYIPTFVASKEIIFHVRSVIATLVLVGLVYLAGFSFTEYPFIYVTLFILSALVNCIYSKVTKKSKD